MAQKKRSKKILRKWHLAMNEEENSIVELEWALLRLMTAFNRFNEKFPIGRLLSPQFRQA